ncbi:MAG: hypothetical protein GC191_14080 [Azospirillum sp.]|nr:hypothetical protein [Azospirillum sp.]
MRSFCSAAPLKRWLGLIVVVLCLTPAVGLAEGGGNKPGEIPLLRLPIFMMPLVSSGSVTGSRSISVEIMVSDVDARTRLAELQPRLVDAIMMKFYGKMTEKTTEREIQKEIRTIGGSYVGSDKIAAVTVEFK